MPRAVRRGFVDSGGRLVHYRRAGSGPPVVLLHDSPRSSVLHLPMLHEFSDAFTVFAPDTPGYGQSDALPADPRPEIDDFGDALAATLEALGLERPVVYAFHTSSKIALSCAIRHPASIGRLILDGVSLPGKPVPEAFIDAYMRPFEIDAEGAYIGREWTRIRDLHRFFPWFERQAQRRIDMAEPSTAAMHAYAMDLFMAGENYSSAYAAAMRYRALAALPQLTTPTTFMARADDVLYAYLDLLDQDRPDSADLARLPADDAIWRRSLRSMFSSADGSLGGTGPPAASRRCYDEFDHGQLHLRRWGTGPRTVLALHDPPGSGLDVQTLAGSVEGLCFIAPDLPGCGLSDPLGATADCDDYARVLAASMARLGVRRFAVLGLGLSVPIAVALAAACPSRVECLLLDGMPLLDGEQASELAERYAPPIVPARDGSHFHATWHRLRDEQLQWPWYDGSRHARRTVAPQLDGRRLHGRLVATLQQPAAYGEACRAALRFNLLTAMATLTAPVTVLDASPDPRYAGADRLAGAASMGRTMRLPETEPGLLGLLRDLLSA